MPAEEGFGALVEGPYIKGDLSDIPILCCLAHPTEKGTADAASSKTWSDTQVEEIDLVEGVLQGCLWMPPDLCVRVTHRLITEVGEVNQDIISCEHGSDCCGREGFRGRCLKEPWQSRGVHRLHIRVESGDRGRVGDSCPADIHGLAVSTRGHRRPGSSIVVGLTLEMIAATYLAPSSGSETPRDGVSQPRCPAPLPFPCVDPNLSTDREK